MKLTQEQEAKRLKIEIESEVFVGAHLRVYEQLKDAQQLLLNARGKVSERNATVQRNMEARAELTEAGRILNGDGIPTPPRSQLIKELRKAKAEVTDLEALCDVLQLECDVTEHDRKQALAVVQRLNEYVNGKRNPGIRGMQL